MKLEQQVCSLELTKKLKQLGVKQESLFIWILTGADAKGEYHTHCVKNNESERNRSNDWMSAFTVAELLHKLPAGTSLLKRTDLETDSIPRYYAETVKHFHPDLWDETAANALAKLLIYLLENKLIPVA